MKQNSIKLGTHGEQYGNWMSNPVFYTKLLLNVDKHASAFFVMARRRPAGLLGGKSRDFNAAMAEKVPQDCLYLEEV